MDPWRGHLPWPAKTMQFKIFWVFFLSCGHTPPKSASISALWPYPPPPSALSTSPFHSFCPPSTPVLMLPLYTTGLQWEAHRQCYLNLDSLPPKFTSPGYQPCGLIPPSTHSIHSVLLLCHMIYGCSSMPATSLHIITPLFSFLYFHRPPVAFHSHQC